MRPTLFYRRLASPLHSTRASVAAAWTGAAIAAILLISAPLALGALVGAILLAGTLTGVRRELLRSLRTAAVVALPIVLVNVIVSREGLTVFARLGDLGPFGQGNLTVEALAYGGVIALKVAAIMLLTTLASLAIDPDELLRVVRGVSFRSALTASLATRMVPLLAADAMRLAEAQRTRAHTPAHARAHTRARARGALVSAIVVTSLDRAMDVAATLELRGFATAARSPRAPRPWSRHDAAFAASALAIVALASASRVGGVARFSAYPQIVASPAWQGMALGAALTAAILLPHAQRRGIQS